MRRLALDAETELAGRLGSSLHDRTLRNFQDSTDCIDSEHCCSEDGSVLLEQLGCLDGSEQIRSTVEEAIVNPAFRLGGLVETLAQILHLAVGINSLLDLTLGVPDNGEVGLGRLSFTRLISLFHLLLGDTDLIRKVMGKDNFLDPFQSGSWHQLLGIHLQENGSREKRKLTRL